ncbi:hypothetical protein [Streptomyces poriticola]
MSFMDDRRERATGRSADPDRFLPVGGAGPALLRTGRARAVRRRPGG